MYPVFSQSVTKKNKLSAPSHSAISYKKQRTHCTQSFDNQLQESNDLSACNSSTIVNLILCLGVSQVLCYRSLIYGLSAFASPPVPNYYKNGFMHALSNSQTIHISVTAWFLARQPIKSNAFIALKAYGGFP